MQRLYNSVAICALGRWAHFAMGVRDGDLERAKGEKETALMAMAKLRKGALADRKSAKPSWIR